MINRARMILVVLLSFSVSAFATPGYEVTGFKINPMEVQKFEAALGEWFKSDAGKKVKGRVLLQTHDNNGADPATHSIVSIYPSLAESEEYSDWVTGNKDALASWMTMVSKMIPISERTSTARYARIAGWGSINDQDRVWMQHAITTKDDVALYRAMDGWMKSETAKKFPGQIHLARVVAAGMGAPSHVISVGFESLAEMEQWNMASAGSLEFTRLLHTFSIINTYHGANLSVDMNAWGKSLKSVLK